MHKWLKFNLDLTSSGAGDKRIMGKLRKTVKNT